MAEPRLCTAWRISGHSYDVPCPRDDISPSDRPELHIADMVDNGRLVLKQERFSEVQCQRGGNSGYYLAMMAWYEDRPLSVPRTLVLSTMWTEPGVINTLILTVERRGTQW